MRDKSFIGSERDWISRCSIYHTWNTYRFNSLFICTMLHCQTATEIYSRSRKCDPLPFATMIDDNVKSNFELIKENFPPISRYIEFCGLMYFNEWSGVFLKSVENVKIIDQGSELCFSVYSCFWGTWPSVPELWPAVCWGRKTLFPDTALTFIECFLSTSEVTVSGLWACSCWTLCRRGSALTGNRHCEAGYP